MTPTTPTALTIARFDPALHDLATFSCGVEEVDSFFRRPHRNEHNFRLRLGAAHRRHVMSRWTDGRSCRRCLIRRQQHLARDAIDGHRGATEFAAKPDEKGRQKPLELGRSFRRPHHHFGRPARDSQRPGNRRSALVRHALNAVTAPVYFLLSRSAARRSFTKKLGFVETPPASLK